MLQISMRLSPRTLAVSIVSLALISSPVLASEDDAVVARIGEKTITEADMTFAAQDFGQELQRFPPSARRKLLLDALIDMEITAHAARELGLDQDAEFLKQMEFLKQRALRSAYLTKEIAANVTDKEVQAAYDKEFADYQGPEELNARHILLKEKEEAEAVIKELDEGADFAALARDKSTGPSGPNGGSLGYFTKGQMVKPFEDAALALEPGAYTKEPVETQFGWHVILLEEKRQQPKPELDKVGEGIRQQLMRDLYEKRMTELRSELSVEIVDESLQPTSSDTESSNSAQ